MSAPVEEQREQFPWLAVLLAAGIVAAVIWVTRG